LYYIILLLVQTNFNNNTLHFFGRHTVSVWCKIKRDMFNLHPVSKESQTADDAISTYFVLMPQFYCIKRIPVSSSSLLIHNKLHCLSYIPKFVGIYCARVIDVEVSLYVETFLASGIKLYEKPQICKWLKHTPHLHGTLLFLKRDLITTCRRVS
jgi:hypothetical protein